MRRWKTLSGIMTTSSWSLPMPLCPSRQDADHLAGDVADADGLVDSGRRSEELGAHRFADEADGLPPRSSEARKVRPVRQFQFWATR